MKCYQLSARFQLVVSMESEKKKLLGSFFKMTKLWISKTKKMFLFEP